MFNDKSKIENTGHVEFNNHNKYKVSFFEVTSYPALGKHLTAKSYLDEAISKSVDESFLLGLYLDE